jgi:hypothetical protein
MTERDREPTERTVWLRAGCVLLGIAVFVVLFVWLLAGELSFAVLAYVHTTVIDEIVARTGLSRYLVKGSLLLAMIPLGFALRELVRLRFSLRRGTADSGKSRALRRPVAQVVVVLYAAGYCLLMFGLTRGTAFDQHGKPVKWYCRAPTTGEMHFFDEPGFCRVHGTKLKEVTPEIISDHIPKAVEYSEDDTFVAFDPRDGAPRLWYTENPESSIELFDAPGVHPRTGKKLLPITPAVVQRLAERSALAKTEEERKRLRVAQEQTKTEQDRQEAAEKRWVSRYVTAEASQNPVAFAVMILNGGEVDRSLSADVARALGTKASAGRLGSALVSDGLHSRLLAGDAELARRLGLNRIARAVAIGEYGTSYVHHPELHDGVTATITCRMTILDARTARTVEAFTVTSKGGGYSEPTSRTAALEKLTRDLSARLGRVAAP